MWLKLRDVLAVRMFYCEAANAKSLGKSRDKAFPDFPGTYLRSGRYPAQRHSLIQVNEL